MHDVEKVRALLVAFLEGDISFDNLRAELAEWIDIDYSNPERRVIRGTMFEDSISIPIRTSHLCKALHRYIAGEISGDELSDWAAFLFMPAFVPEGDTEEERWEAGEGATRDILQRLLTPQVFDGLNPTVAYTYVRLLGCSKAS